MNALSRVAIEVGNSSLKTACEDPSSDGAEGLRIEKIHLSDDWLQCAQQLARRLHEETSPEQWLIASVNRTASRQLAVWIREQFSMSRCIEVDYRCINLKIDVSHPERVGIDRLLAARGAHQRSDGDAAMSIDAGTAITVDVVNSDGVFLGGEIIPGVGMQFDALHRATDQLPLVNHRALKDRKISFPARETAEAMICGVMQTLAGGLHRVIDQVAQSCTLGTVLLTGGDADLVSKWLERDHKVVHELPLRSLHSLDIRES